MSDHYSLSESYRKEHLKHLPMLRASRLPTVAQVFGIGTFITIIMVALFLALVPWVQTVHGAGQIVALNPSDREQPISALVPGRIAEWYVREGSIVKTGDPIARIVDNDPNLLSRLKQQLNASRARLVSAQSALDTAKLDRDRKEKLWKDGLVSRLEYEQALIKVNEQEVQVQSAQREVNSAEVQLSQQGSQIVEAPRPGIITRISAGGTATFVKAGDLLARIAPSGVERAVELYVDSLDAALLDPGRQVRLQFEGWPAIQFSGWPAVAVGTFAGEVSFIEPLASRNGKFRVVVQEKVGDDNLSQPWPGDQYLRLGTAARGWILLDEVRVGYELWRRMNNFPPEFTGQAANKNASGVNQNTTSGQPASGSTP